MRTFFQFSSLIMLIWLCTSGSVSAQGKFEHQVYFGWDNDMFFRRDFYYSNGFHAGFYAPALEKSPFSLILLPGRNKNNLTEYHGIQLSQKIYTPRDLSMDTICAGDQPYVSTLTIQQTIIRLIPETGLRIGSGFQVGVMGPAALGFITQEIAHSVSNPSRPPMGWDYQVQNDIILNYDFYIEKNLLPPGTVFAGVAGQGRLGTLHTDIEGGVWLAVDKRRGYFNRLGPSGDPGFNLLFKSGISARYVLYDATLQGGFFNKSSPYFLDVENINTWIGELNAKLVIEYNQHQLECQANWISKRFINGCPHAWANLVYRFWF